MRISIIAFICLLSFSCTNKYKGVANTETDYQVIPKPSKLDMLTGKFLVDGNTKIVGSEALKNEGDTVIIGELIARISEGEAAQDKVSAVEPIKKQTTPHSEPTAFPSASKLAKEKGEDLWGTTAQAHTGHVASWYEYYESIAPTFGVYNWGIDADNNYSASVANGGSMNSDKAKEAMTWWLSMHDIAPPESPASTWTEVGTTFGAGRAAQSGQLGRQLVSILSRIKI